MTKYEGFKTLLYYKFIYTKTHRVEEVAEKMGISPVSLYKYISGQMSFPVDLVAKLYNSTGDIEFLNFILNDTDKMLAPREAASKEKSLEAEALDVAGAAGRLVSDIQEATSDDKVNDIEKKKLENRIDAVQKELEDARKALKKA